MDLPWRLERRSGVDGGGREEAVLVFSRRGWRVAVVVLLLLGVCVGGGWAQKDTRFQGHAVQWRHPAPPTGTDPNLIAGGSPLPRHQNALSSDGGFCLHFHEPS